MVTKNKKGTRPEVKAGSRIWVKLDLDTVSEIRKLLSAEPRLRYAKIATKYGVSMSTISNIRHNKIYPAMENDPNDFRTEGKKLSYKQVKEILDFLENPNGPLSDLAEKYGVSICTISNIKYGRTYSALVSERNIDRAYRHKREFPKSLSEGTLQEIVHVLSNGEFTIEEVAAKFGTYAGLVSRIKRKFCPEVSERFKCKLLTGPQVKEMIALLKQGHLRSKELQDLFNCSWQVVNRVKKRFCPEAAGPKRLRPTLQKK
ncbi:hypothetical protein [Chitinophaga eiseniae]|nr:hypothetical protein [Chitinophaga eiseniae]